MANNNILYNAAFRALVVGLASRWISDVPLTDAATAFASEVDSLIAPSTYNEQDSQLLLAIGLGVWSNRYPTSADAADYTQIATEVVAFWEDARVHQLPVSGGGGGGSPSFGTNLVQVSDGAGGFIGYDGYNLGGSSADLYFTPEIFNAFTQAFTFEAFEDITNPSSNQTQLYLTSSAFNVNGDGVFDVNLDGSSDSYLDVGGPLHLIAKGSMYLSSGFTPGDGAGTFITSWGDVNIAPSGDLYLTGDNVFSFAPVDFTGASIALGDSATTTDVTILASNIIDIESDSGLQIYGGSFVGIDGGQISLSADVYQFGSYFEMHGSWVGTLTDLNIEAANSLEITCTSGPFEIVSTDIGWGLNFDSAGGINFIADTDVNFSVANKIYLNATVEVLCNSSFTMAPTTTLTADMMSAQAIWNTSLIDQSGGPTTTVYWMQGSSQAINVIENVVITMDFPPGPMGLTLKLVENGHTVTFADDIAWENAVAPTLSGATDILSFWYDGTNLYGSYLLNCSVPA